MEVDPHTRTTQQDDEHLKLFQQQNQRLQLENKTLKLRVQGVQVLGKVLQESEEDKVRLTQEVIDLKEQLKHAGIDSADMQSLLSQQSQTSMPSSGRPGQPQPGPVSRGQLQRGGVLPGQFQTVLPGQPQTANMLPGQLQTSTEHLARCFLSKPGDKSVSLPDPFGSQSYEYVNLNPSPGDPSLSMDYSLSSLALGGDLHIKKLKSGFHALKEDTENLIKQVTDALNRCKEQEGCAEQKIKLKKLLAQLENHGQEAKTRESLLWGLASQEEQLKEKFIEIETEQLSQEKVMTQLQKIIEHGKEELDQLRDEINFLNETVVVRREDVPSPSSILSSSCTSVSEESANKSASPFKLQSHGVGGLQMAGSGPGHACRTCLQHQEQIKDLQRALEQTKNERNEAITLKEEIIDVNHAWDAQYKKLEADSRKETIELKQQLEFLKSGDHDKKDKLWLSAKSMIDAEKKAKEEAIEENKALLDAARNLQGERTARSAELEELKSNIAILEVKLRNQGQTSNATGWTDTESFWTQLTHQPPMPQSQVPPQDTVLPVPPYPVSEASLPPASITREASTEMINEIEVLKQQLRVYADDFTSEREDRERMQAEKEKLSVELKAVKEQVLALEEQLRVYEEDFQRERREGDRLRRQLQSTQQTTKPQYRGTEDHMNEMTRRAQAVAEQQARLRSLRDQYNLEERRLLQEQQELEQAKAIPRPAPRQFNPNYPSYPNDPRRAYGLSWQQQQPMRARGPMDSPSARQADDMFHGGEVQPDTRLGREVVDAPGQIQDPAPGDNACPRCLRSFPQGDHEALIKHVDRCIE